MTERPWRPSRPAVAILGIVSAWPIVYMGLFFASMGYMFTSLDSRHAERGPMLFKYIFPLHLMTMMLMFALMAIYVVHAYRSDLIASDKKVLWVVILFFGNFVAFPIYWYLFMWRQPSLDATVRPEDALFDAVRRQNLDEVRNLVRNHPQLVSARDARGATPLHHAAESGNREIARALIDAGADINARDPEFHATPAGWAIEYLRERGALLGMEIDDLAHAIARGDAVVVERCVRRLPALRDAADRNGTPLRELAAASGSPEMTRVFEE